MCPPRPAVAANLCGSGLCRIARGLAKCLKSVLTNADIYGIIEGTKKGENMIDRAKRVYVYFNLHKKCWSVRQSGRIVAHTNEILLKECRFLVSQAGREKVLRDKRKNVHAGVSGYVVDSFQGVERAAVEVTYNPYRYKTFVSKLDPFDPVEHSDYAVLTCGSGWRIVEAIWK